MSDEEKDNEFPAKWKKVLDKTGFMEEAEAMDEEQLKTAIYACEGHIYTIEKSKKDNSKLQAAKEIAKEEAKPYNEAKKFQTAKINYCLFLLEGKGVDLEKA